MSTVSPIPTIEDVLKLRAFDTTTRYCIGSTSSSLWKENAHALDDGFWGRPVDTRLLEKEKEAQSRFGGSSVIVYCRWCREHLSIPCNPIDVPSLLAKGEKNLGDIPRGLFNSDFTGLSSYLVCASAQTHSALSSWTKGDFTVSVVRASSNSNRAGYVPVNALFRRPSKKNIDGDITTVTVTPTSASASGDISVSGPVAEVQFLAPTLTEFAISITHNPTRESHNASVKRQKQAAAAVGVQEQSGVSQVPRPCFFVDRLIVDDRVVNTRWKGEPVFCTSGTITLSGYDWEATNAGSFLFKGHADNMHQDMLIQLVLRTATWLPPTKSALPHTSVHGALQSYEQQSAVMAYQSTSSSFGVSAPNCRSFGRTEATGLAARLQQNRVAKKDGQLPDKDNGAGQRIIHCPNLASTVGKTFTVDPDDSHNVRCTIGVSCCQTAAAVQKDNARAQLHEYGLDYWKLQQKQSRKRIREAEKQLEDLRKDLDDVNNEVTHVVRQHAGLVRLFTSDQLDGESDDVSVADSSTETRQVAARLDELEQARFAACNMHYEV